MTGHRIRSYYEEAGYTVSVFDPREITLANAPVLFCHDFKLALAVHVIRSGSLFLEVPLLSDLPFVVLFSGTDLFDTGNHELCYRIVQRSRLVITLTNDARILLQSKWPDVAGKIRTMTQAPLILKGPLSFDVKSLLPPSTQCIQSQTPTIISLIAGIRPVKDPLFILDAFNNFSQRYLSKTGTTLILLLVGPVLDEPLGAKLSQTLSVLNTPHIHYVGQLPHSEAQSVIRHSFAAINTSLTEGGCIALLEAMALGTPVLARATPGNTDIVFDEINGLLFHTPQEFTTQLERLLHTKTLYDTLVVGGKRYIHEYHNVDKERSGYLEIITSFSQ